MKSITVFYRSNEASNRYISATKSKTDTYLDKTIVTIHYENLDKRKFENYFKKNTIPDYVFIWEDEEILIEYIQTNYPNIKIETMSGKDREYDKNTYYGNPNTFKIYERINEIVERDIPVVIYYKIYGNRIEEKKDKQTKINGEYFLTKKDATDKLIKDLDEKINYHKTQASYYEDILKKYR